MGFSSNFGLSLIFLFAKFFVDKTSHLFLLRGPLPEQTEQSKKYDPERSTERSSSGKFGPAHQFSCSAPERSSLILDQPIPGQSPV